MSISASSETVEGKIRLLDGIHSPADVKALPEESLAQLAQEVRDELIEVLSQTGGHLGPNLGVVELTIALHRVFNTPHDRLLQLLTDEQEETWAKMIGKPFKGEFHFGPKNTAAK